MGLGRVVWRRATNGTFVFLIPVCVMSVGHGLVGSCRVWLEPYQARFVFLGFWKASPCGVEDVGWLVGIAYVYLQLGPGEDPGRLIVHPGTRFILEYLRYLPTLLTIGVYHATRRHPRYRSPREPLRKKKQSCNAPTDKKKLSRLNIRNFSLGRQPCVPSAITLCCLAITLLSLHSTPHVSEWYVYAGHHSMTCFSHEDVVGVRHPFS